MRSGKKDIYRKELIIDFLISNNIIQEDNEEPVIVFFILNQCGTCTESFTYDFMSLKEIDEFASQEVQIIASRDTYEYVFSLDSITNTNVQGYDYSFLEDNGFIIALNYLYIIEKGSKIKSFAWLDEIDFNELVNLFNDLK